MTQHFEYKTVAIAQTISRRRKRKETAVHVIQSETTDILNNNAVEGWEFIGTEIMKTFDRKGMFGAPTEKNFTVFLFKRPILSYQTVNNDPVIQDTVRGSETDNKISALS